MALHPQITRRQLSAGRAHVNMNVTKQHVNVICQGCTSATHIDYCCCIWTHLTKLISTKLVQSFVAHIVTSDLVQEVLLLKTILVAPN